MDPAKLDLARRLFVFDCKSLSDICISLDLSMFELDSVSKASDWIGQREKQKLKREAASGNTLERHREMTAQHLRHIEVLLVRQADPDLTLSERKQLRYQIEDAKAAAEALAITIEVDRMVHGVPSRSPSVARDTEEVQGVRYFVSLPPVVPVQEDASK